jgi:hypothetical protein
MEKLATEDNFVNRGGTVRPVYGERRPVMYHLFETEMNAVSAFNGEALRWFSIASFCLSLVVAILVGWAFSNSPLSEFGNFLLHRATWYFRNIVSGSFRLRYLGRMPKEKSN